MRSPCRHLTVAAIQLTQASSTTSSHSFTSPLCYLAYKSDPRAGTRDLSLFSPLRRAISSGELQLAVASHFLTHIASSELITRFHMT